MEIVIIKITLRTSVTSGIKQAYSQIIKGGFNKRKRWINILH